MKLAWSNIAVDEMRALRRYSVERWRVAVAMRYLTDVRDAAKQVVTWPDRARPLKGPLRLMSVRSHYLIVHVDATADRLTIARVSHSAMDLDRHLPAL